MFIEEKLFFRRPSRESCLLGDEKRNVKRKLGKSQLDNDHYMSKTDSCGKNEKSGGMRVGQLGKSNLELDRREVKILKKQCDLLCGR